MTDDTASHPAIRTARLELRAVEGHARDHVQIQGRWEDHVLTSLTNPDWVDPA